MKTMRIRTFTALCLLLILLLPWLFFVTAHYLENDTIRFATNQTYSENVQRHMNEAMHLIEANADKWTDPAWQKELHLLVQQARMEVVLLSASGEELYRSHTKHDRALSAVERYSIIADGHLLGKVVMYLPKSNTLQMIAAFAGLVLAFLIVGATMRRLLLRPLEKMSAAARQIARGNWDVQLPSSGIAEIAEVGDGFGVMVKGLETSRRKQAELEEERRFVIAAVAHDLRTPLFALRGYLDGLEQGIAQTPDKMRKYVAVCKEKSAQLDRLVEDLFTFAKMEYVEAKPHDKTVDLAHVWQQALDSLRPQAELKQIALSAHFADGCLIRCDRHLLERAINNLLDNAVRYTPAHGYIAVHCAREGQFVQFAIRDTGPGFSPEELQRVFEPLYRGEESRNRSTGGSGLGLTISQRIVRLHGGDLAASNHPAGGALLTGFIPAHREKC